MEFSSLNQSGPSYVSWKGGPVSDVLQFVAKEPQRRFFVNKEEDGQPAFWKLEVLQQIEDLPGAELVLEGEKTKMKDCTGMLVMNIEGEGLGPESGCDFLSSGWESVLKAGLNSGRMAESELQLAMISRNDCGFVWQFQHKWEMGTKSIPCLHPTTSDLREGTSQSPRTGRSKVSDCKVDIDFYLSRGDVGAAIAQLAEHANSRIRPRPLDRCAPFQTPNGHSFQETLLNSLPVQDGRWHGRVLWNKGRWDLAGTWRVPPLASDLDARTYKVTISVEGQRQDFPNNWSTLDQIAQEFLQGLKWSGAEGGTNVNELTMHHETDGEDVSRPFHQWSAKTRSISGHLTFRGSCEHYKPHVWVFSVEKSQRPKGDDYEGKDIEYWKDARDHDPEGDLVRRSV